MWMMYDFLFYINCVRLLVYMDDQSYNTWTE